MRVRSDGIAPLARAASSQRRDLGVARSSPLDVVSAASGLGFEVRYEVFDGIEGVLFVNGSGGLVLVNSRRPPGRQAFTIAHELGHALDPLELPNQALRHCTAGSSGRVEWRADAVAAFLLMPRAAVLRALELMRDDGPLAWLRASQWLGVGYESLLVHAEANLRIIGSTETRILKRTRPRMIAASALSGTPPSTCWFIDEHWTERHSAVVEVGDHIALPTGLNPAGGWCQAAPELDSGWTVGRVQRPGLHVIMAGEVLIEVAASPKEFAGRSRYRFIE